MAKGSGHLLGLDIGGTKCAVVLGDPKARILDRLTFPTPRGFPAAFRTLTASIDQLLQKHRTQASSLLRIGVSCGGPLDSRQGLILSPPNLPGWDRIPLTKLLRRKLGRPVQLENDANACALAEWRFGAGRGTRNMVFLTFGTGMGAGLILDGKLYRGTKDLAGEVGHLRMAPAGPLGYGKAGSFEGFCSGGGLARLARLESRKAGGWPRALRGPAVRGVTAKDLCEAALRGDAFSRKVLAMSGRVLGRGLAVLVDLLNPERIVIGGIFARKGGVFLRRSMQRELAREALGPARRVCKVAPSALGEALGDQASLCVALGTDKGE